MPVLLIPSMCLVWVIRPDPREIARNIRDYFPEEAFSRSVPPTWWQSLVEYASGWPATHARGVYLHFVAQGVMTMMMAMTPLALAHHGHELPMISLAVALHVVGMFGSLLANWAIDRSGRPAQRHAARCDPERAGLTHGCGDRGVLDDDTGYRARGRRLVVQQRSGLGLDRRSDPSGERGRAIGTDDMLSGAGSIALPLIGGPLVAIAGLPVLALISAVLLSVPMVMLVRVRESRGGAL